MKTLLSLIIALFASSQAVAQLLPVKGFNLTEIGGFVYDAAPEGQAKKHAQIAVDEAKRLGANHIILNVRATMQGPFSNEIVPTTAPSERSGEAKRMVSLIRYIKSQGMTVGIRPIFFVVGPNGEFPYIEKQADGTLKVWWHGNIQPRDPNRWFESFRVFIDQYLTIARATQAEEFTIGAELYSMTVGIEDQWKEHPYGFPGRWLELLRFARTKLPKARLMYDINFTDEVDRSSGIAASGGELERWRYRLVDLAGVGNPLEQEIYCQLVSFWTELDAIGIDMYRSLAGPTDEIPSAYPALVNLLKVRTDAYAGQLDSTATQIELTLGVEKKLILKEIGYRSVEKGFIDPFAYAGSGSINIGHQAAAFEALFESFISPNWPWYGGVNVWDISIDPSKKGASDNGFSPVGKDLTESVFSRFFQN